MVGVLPWSGPEPPTRKDIAGLKVVKHGLTRIEIVTEGGLRVTDHSPLVPHGLHSRHDHERYATTSVWGWRTATRIADAWWPLDPMFTHLPDLERQLHRGTTDYDPHELVRFVFTTDTYPKWSQERWIDLALRWLEDGLSIDPVAAEVTTYALELSNFRPLRQRAAYLLGFDLPAPGKQ